MAHIEAVAQAVEAGKIKIVAGLVEEALAEGIDPLEILNKGMIGAMGVVGEKFKRSEIYVPEMLVAAKTMKKGLEALRPRLAGNAAASRGVCIIGTVAGDWHDIGKNLVAMMLESAGFEIVDLGVDVPAETFIAALRQHAGAKIVALSALLTTTMPAMGQIIEAVKASGAKGEGCKILVGGAPITQAYADQIGADGYAPDAASAAVMAAGF
ncbi:MAG: corrinoid protein [Spirochaetaceae bacterium]|jgi:methanogenic corrinoid protein MtbC1|nr:corrinoid protein [Spirochaetaceae bacterium]